MSFEKIMLMRSQSDLLLTLILWGEGRWLTTWTNFVVLFVEREVAAVCEDDDLCCRCFLGFAFRYEPLQVEPSLIRRQDRHKRWGRVGILRPSHPGDNF
jgi:hypothetical protein